MITQKARTWTGIGQAVLLAATVFPAGAGAQEFVYRHTFKSTALNRNDRTGRRVTLSEKYALVSSTQAHDGVAKIYDVASRELVFAVPPPKRGRDGHYGSRFDVHADTALICGKGYDREPETHRAILFDIPTGRRLHRLYEPGPGVKTGFADACALSDRHALVGALTSGQDKRGAAFLYDTATGKLIRRFDPPSPQRWGRFGAQVALSGKYAAISARAVRQSHLDEGAVHIFDVETGALLQMLHPKLFSRSRTLGFAISGDRLLLGTTKAKGREHKTAVALLFDIPTGQLIRRFAPPPDLRLDSFGGSVALNEKWALIGASTARAPDESYYGAAFLYDVSTGALVQTITRPESIGGLFAVSVALQGNNILIGHWRDSLLNSGAAHLFRAGQP